MAPDSSLPRKRALTKHTAEVRLRGKARPEVSFRAGFVLFLPRIPWRRAGYPQCISPLTSQDTPPVCFLRFPETGRNHDENADWPPTGDDDAASGSLSGNRGERSAVRRLRCDGGPRDASRAHQRKADRGAVSLRPVRRRAYAADSAHADGCRDHIACPGNADAALIPASRSLYRDTGGYGAMSNHSTLCWIRTGASGGVFGPSGTAIA
jgi:hypothetical protein